MSDYVAYNCSRFYYCFLLIALALGACGINKSSSYKSKTFSVDQFCNLLKTDDNLNCEEYASDSTRIDVIVNQNGILFSAIIFDDDIQADFTQRDTGLYKESCFEIFFDPDADGLYYYEIEVNARGTIFDFILKDAIGPLNSNENMINLHIPQSNLEIELNGTLNDSRDKDLYWSFDLFVPWKLLKEGRPKKGSSWAFNFMRVDRDKVDNPTYWVWKPTGSSLIHNPDTWPRITF